MGSRYLRIVLALFFLVCIQINEADAWLNSYAYRTPVLIENPSSAKTDYQILVTFDTQSLGSKMKADCSDLRITDQDENTQLSFWIEGGCKTANTKIWVKVPSLPSGERIIYLYYGNNAAVTASNFGTVFPSSYIVSGSVTLTGQQTYDWFEVPSGTTLTLQQGSYLNITARKIKISGTVNGQGKGYSGGGNDGYGPGAGRDANDDGGGGAGYGGAGGNGGGTSSSNGGSAYGQATTETIEMGSGGAGGDGSGSAAGGNGGGAIKFISSVIEISGIVNMNGSAGSDAASRAGGGGSGGGILLKAPVVDISGKLWASGGNGGVGTNGGTDDDGGGGGAGGRIKIFYGTLASSAGSIPSSPSGGKGICCQGDEEDGQSGTTHTTTVSFAEPTYSLGSEEEFVPENWLSGWTYRKPVLITGIGSVLTEYQVKLTVNTQELIQDGRLQNGCQDIRITDEDGTTLLTHWIETPTCNTASTFIWVKIPSLPSSSKTVYVYYGKSGESSASNGPGTFIFFEDFDPDKNTWTVQNGAWSSVAGYSGNAKRGACSGCSGSSTSTWRQTLAGPSIVSSDFTLHAKMKSSADSSLANLIVRAADQSSESNNRIWIRIDHRNYVPARGFHIFEDVDGVEHERGGYDFEPVVDQWYDVRVTFNGNYLYGYLNEMERIANAYVSRTSAGYILLQVETSDGNDAVFDNIFLRKYSSSEPSVSAPGTQETATSRPTSIFITGVPTGWQKVDATAAITCRASDGSDCTTSTKKFITYSSSRTCPTTASSYTENNPKTVSSHAWFCATGKSSDGKQGYTSSSIEFKVDKQKPTVTLLGASDTWKKSPVTATVSCSDTGGSQCIPYTYKLEFFSVDPVTCRENYLRYTLSPDTPISERTWVCAAGQDGAGNTDFSEPLEFKVDSYPPIVNTTGAPSTWQNTTATATTTCEDEGGSLCISSSLKQRHFTSDPGACPEEYSTYSKSSPQSITSHVWICSAGKDGAGNTVFSNVSEFKVDRRVPRTTPSQNDTNWYLTDQYVVLACADNVDSDPYSGCQSTEYCIKNATMSSCTFMPYLGGSITVSDNGENIVRFRSTDNAGNRESVKTATVRIDKNPPLVNYTTIPSSFNGVNGWYSTKPVTVTISCSDAASGCSSINYCAVQGSSCPQASVSGSSVTFNITAEGDTFINFSATDMSGQQSLSYVEHVKIDTRNPVVTVTVTRSAPDLRAGSGWYTSDVTVSLNCNDPMPGSGCSFHRWCENANCTNTDVAVGTNPLEKTYSLTNVYDLALSSYDVAGRFSTNATTVRLDKDKPILANTFFHNGTNTTLASGPHGNVTDHYQTLYLVADMTDSPNGSGILLGSQRAVVVNETNVLLKNVSLSQAYDSDTFYNSFLIQGNVTYGNYTGNFSVEDVAGWKTILPALNNKLEITALEFNDTDSQEILRLSENGLIDVVVGNEKIIFATVTNKFANTSNVLLTLSTTPSGAPVTYWTWFTDYKYDASQRTRVSATVESGNVITLPVTALGGIAPGSYAVQITANFTTQKAIYQKNISVQVVAANRSFFSTSPEPVSILLILTLSIGVTLLLTRREVK